MKDENWIMGSHRTVDRLVDQRRVAICEIYSGAADSIEQADRFQQIIAAAPDMFCALQAIIEAVNDPMCVLLDESMYVRREEWGGLTAMELVRAAITKATGRTHPAGASI